VKWRPAIVIWLLLWLAIGLAAWLGRDLWLPSLLAGLGRHGITLAAPRLLLACLTAVTVSMLAPLGLTDLPVPQRALQVIVRTALLALIAAAASGPHIEQVLPRPVQVVHLVDRSQSVPDALMAAGAQGARATAEALRRRAPQAGDAPRVAVLAFDGTVDRLPWPPTATDAQNPQALVPPQILRQVASGQDTDLAGALDRALALLDGQCVPHFVLWTDGIETRGDAAELAPVLRAVGVRVHTPALPPLPVRGEFIVDRFDLPPQIRANVPFPVAIQVQATAQATVRCSVRSGTVAVAPVEHTVLPGATRIELGDIRLRQGGPADLAAQCDVVRGDDRFATNNKLRARVIVQARPRVLYVEGAANQSQYLARALVDDFEVDIQPADGLPRTAAALKRYQAIVLSDVPRVSAAGVPLLTDGDMRNLDAYARQGGGLLVIGGENSLGSGGYQDTYLDKVVLPVRMDVESTVQAPTIALMLCIDRSGSMAGSKMELAKEAARATAEAMAPEDRIGVIAFDSEARQAVRLQRAGNRYKIATDISRLTPSGGTHIYPALDQAYQTLLTAQAKVKHVILLTDGQAPKAGIDALVRQMRRSGMTVSTVGVGSDVDRGLLESIADRGGGRSYFTDRPETLPRIFVRETHLIAGDSVVEKQVRARRVGGLGRIDLLRGVAVEHAPGLSGFLPTRVKPGAEEILATSTHQPLLVRWRLGLGKVSVWTSDLKNRWAAAWIDWPGYAVLARQIVRDLLQEDLGTQVPVRLIREREQLRIALDAIDEDDRYMPGLWGQAEVQGPDGAKTTLALHEVATGRYEASVPLTAQGPYDVFATLRASRARPVIASGRATAVHPYPDEYRLPDPQASGLAELVRATGGKENAVLQDWLDDHGAQHRSLTPLWPDLAAAALLLLVLDVALRRVRLGRATTTPWHALRKRS